MRESTKFALAVAAVASLAIPKAAWATDGSHGVFFVHGTGDQSRPSSNHGFQATNDGATSAYWTQSALQSFVTSPDGTGQWSYGVAGYQGGTYAAYDPNSWGVIGDQLWDYYMYGNAGAVYHVVVVTHSNGSNPIRYMMAHPGSTTPGGVSVSSILGVISRAIFIAGDNMGTPLADKVTSSGSLANIANDIVSFFGGGSYANAAVQAQVQANMHTYNTNGTFATGSSPGGISTQYLYGTGVNATLWSSEAWCGGYAQSVGLKAAQVYGWGSSSATTDGFIGSVNYSMTDGAGATQTISSKLVGVNGMPGSVGDTRLNHNQSRRNCDGFASTVANNIRGAMSGTFTATPPDYTLSPGQYACDMIDVHNFSLGTDSSNNVWTSHNYGCSASQQASNTTVWRDCLTGYGNNAGLVMPTDYANSQVAYSQAANYTHQVTTGNGTYGTTATSACPDTWLGDGKCDMCLLAKYGYDSQSGQTADDDCVTAAPGHTNICYDVIPAYKNGTYQFDFYQGYYTYHCAVSSDCANVGCATGTTSTCITSGPTAGFCSVCQ